MKCLLLLSVVVLAATACGSTQQKAATADASPRQCPATWREGWQSLANRIHAVVYCPTWMPDPLDAKIGGVYSDIDSVSPDRSYLISFLWQETGSGEVHVNLRGYPGRARIPICSDLDTNKPVPCFSDAKGTVHAGAITARVYTANQGADQWHVLYAWHRSGSLYAISEHVAPPYTYAHVIRNLNRMLAGLVPVQPRH